MEGMCLDDIVLNEGDYLKCVSAISRTYTLNKIYKVYKILLDAKERLCIKNDYNEYCTVSASLFIKVDKPIKDKPVEQAMRFNTGKAEFFDAPILALAEVAKVAAYGRSKYDQYNWKKGGPASQYHDCRQRHELKYWYGQDKDSESKCSHLAHIAWNALAALELQITGNLDDNRYKGYSDDFVNNLEDLFLLNIEQKDAIRIQLDKKKGK